MVIANPASKSLLRSTSSPIGTTENKIFAASDAVAVDVNAASIAVAVAVDVVV